MKTAIRCFAARAILLAAMVGGAHGATEPWYQKPFLVYSGNRPLDTRDVGGKGYAAPFLADIDGDGKRDLVVGDFSGRFRLHRNIGTDSAPRFGEASSWVYAGDEEAKVPIYCCVAAGPQLVDLNGDGILDLVAGSYDPGAIYFFRGLGKGKFAERQMLTEALGYSVFARPTLVPDSSPESYARTVNFVSNVAFADWDNDGVPDMLIGTGKGELYLKIGRRPDADGPAYTPNRSQPVFVGAGSGALLGRDEIPGEIRIGGKKAIPSGHAAPSVADWDGDGRWDIILGSSHGSVYLLRNSGKPGAPEFKSCEELVGPGKLLQWTGTGEEMTLGIRSQVQAVDYNRDGKMDLLVGCWTVTQSPRAGLSPDEAKEMTAIRAELENLDREVGFQGDCFRAAHDGYKNDRPRFERMEALEKRLSQYLVVEDRGVTFRIHGYVWVLLRK